MDYQPVVVGLGYFVFLLGFGYMEITEAVALF